jgi:hypothetical protein
VDAFQAASITPVGVSAAGRRAGLVALASAGALSAHTLGYSSASVVSARGGDVPHGHLVLLGWLGGVAAAVAVLALAVAGARRASCCPELRLRALLAAQVGVYGWLEISERALQGEPMSGLLTTPVLLGLLAQPLTAWVLVVLLTATTAAVRRLVRRRARLVVPVPLRPVVPVPVRWAARLVLPPTGSRAPPVC